MEKVLQIAKRIKEAGGRAMLVGGCVRDEIMGLTPKDFDIEVYHLAPEKLREIVAEFGKVDAVGASFQVYKVGQDIDISLPRRERKTGIGHKGFTVEGDPEMSFEEACSRRDFTINAIMKDPLTGEIVDPFNGRIDIKDKILRAISKKTFEEDSLRVLRLAQFASRFDFRIGHETADMAKRTDLSDLPKERIWMEMEKLLLKSPKPSVGIKYLIDLFIVDKVSPYFYITLSRLGEVDKVKEFGHSLSDYERLIVTLAILTLECPRTIVLEDFGLKAKEIVEAVNQVIKIIHWQDVCVTNHLNKDDFLIHKLSQGGYMKLGSVALYALNSQFATRFDEKIRKLGIERGPIEPVIKGRHLIEMGVEPSERMGELLKILYEKQLRGMREEELYEYATKLI